MDDLRNVIGKNLSDLRKRKGLTQLELAEKFNYTDRAVSKWENGDTLPDVEVLYNLCEFYGVTIDYLTHEDNYRYVKSDSKDNLTGKVLIMAMVSLLVWTLATVIMVISLIRKTTPLWQAFVWAVPANALLLVIFNKAYFHSGWFYFVCWTLFIWAALAATFLSIMDMNLWPLFILGVPAQAAIAIWLKIRLLREKHV